MQANIVLDDDLLKKAFQLSNAKNETELFKTMLSEFIANHNRKNLMELKGKIDFRDNYDYKKMREKRKIGVLVD